MFENKDSLSSILSNLLVHTNYPMTDKKKMCEKWSKNIFIYKKNIDFNYSSALLLLDAKYLIIASIFKFWYLT